MIKKSYPRRVDSRDTQDNKYERVNVMKIVADQYPADGADYAIHLWYKAHGHNPRIRITERSFNTNDMETAMLNVNDERWEVNIRTGVFKKLA